MYPSQLRHLSESQLYELEERFAEEYQSGIQPGSKDVEQHQNPFHIPWVTEGHNGYLEGLIDLFRGPLYPLRMKINLDEEEEVKEEEEEYIVHSTPTLNIDIGEMEEQAAEMCEQHDQHIEGEHFARVTQDAYLGFDSNDEGEQEVPHQEIVL